MQKIKNSVFNRMLQARLTRAELDFILHISHCQDDSGRVIGVYYRDVCSAIHISSQTFYDVLKSLANKNLITIEKNHYGDWDITLCGNDFNGQFEGYISTGDDIFFAKEFQRLKPQEKLLAMQFLKITKNPNNGGKYRIEEKHLQEKYCGILGVTGRILRRYLRHLKRFFSIGTSRGGLCFIRPLQGVGKKELAPKDRELTQEHVSSVVFRRQRVSGPIETLRDTANLLSQYADRLRDRAAELFAAAVEASIRLSNEGVKNRFRWNREIKPPFIHKLLREQIAGAEKGAAF